jgi:histidinol-phosphate/aromatic aminotransferase/cobyric acid decarboxylase-like protein
VGLAIDSYDGLRALGDEDGLLNLAWTLDERDCLAVDLAALVAGELDGEVREDLPWVRRYLVDDPFGEAALARPAAAYLGVDVGRLVLTCGAGVVSLLQALAPLAGNAPTYVAGDLYPDLPHWVARRGGRCVAGPSESEAKEHALAARSVGAALVVLERPSFVGDRFADPRELRTLCHDAGDAIVLVDESNANYCPPAFSAAPLVPELDNLIVLRGFSKGYGLGGLRLGFAVASPSLRERVRALVPPLLASSLSLRIGAAVLRSGDVARPLRDRIAESRAELSRLLQKAGFTELVRASEPLPYALLDECDGPRLERMGVLGKRHVRWSGAAGRGERIYRVSAPLAPARRRLLRERLSS